MSEIQLLCKISPDFKASRDIQTEYIKKYFSSTYGGTIGNYVVSIFGKRELINNTIHSLLCVVENIIQRGKITIPSIYLQEKLGNMDNTPLFLFDEGENVWCNIFGDSEGDDYPAQYFFEELLNEYLGEYAFAKRYMLPGVGLKDLLKKNRSFDGHYVDFYLPQTKSVFIIDRNQNKDTTQSKLEKNKDRALELEGYTVFRIYKDDINKKTLSLAMSLNNLKQRISESLELMSSFNSRELGYENVNVQYDLVMRFQIALLNVLKNGVAIFDKTIDIRLTCADDKDTEVVEKLFLIAYKDLKLWFDNIAGLLHRNISFPSICLKSGNADIDINFSMFKHYTDLDFIDKKDGTVVIRNAYIDEADYFTLACSELIEYNMPSESYQEDDDRLLFLLKNIFGHSNFRNGQIPIIKRALQRKDTIGILPTGTGKSLCYQLCALLQPSMTLVIVPIISLMLDQKKGLKNKHIDRVENISSNLSSEEKNEIVGGFSKGKYLFMLISPERMQNNAFVKNLGQINKEHHLAYAVVDEAHTLSEWGHDFRVAYLKLVSSLRKYCGDIKLLGLTATASQAVLNDLKVEFRVNSDAVVALASMDRPELEFKHIRTRSFEEKIKRIDDIISQQPLQYTNQDGTVKNQANLVFCPIAKEYAGKVSCEGLFKHLNKQMDTTLMYHAEYDSKKKAQERFMQDDFQGTMVCTKAFGMGIDKESVKVTIHASVPSSIESFYQEAGRAGRDEDKSNHSTCYVLYNIPSEDQKLLVELFSPNLSIKERADLSNHLKGDIDTIFYFWRESRRTIDEDYRLITSVLNQLMGNITRVVYYNTQKELSNIQYALYRLSILKIVDDWMIDYVRKAIKVSYLGYADESVIKKALLEYIHKYDPEFSLDGHSNRYQKYVDIYNTSNSNRRIGRYFLLLISWYNDNIVQGRLQSTYNMLQLCSEDVSDEEFRQRLENYFKYTDAFGSFDAIVDNPYRISILLDFLFEHTNDTNSIVSTEKASEYLATLSRYLESYSQNTGLNYLNGMLRLITNLYNGTEGRNRLVFALQNMKEKLDEVDLNRITDATIMVVEKLNIENKSWFSEDFLTVFPEKLEETYRRLHDYVSTARLLRRQVRDIRRTIKEDLYGSN